MPRGVYQNHAKGSRCRRWNGGRMISSHGYPKIRVGRTHPLADANGYAYEHLVVWASAGFPLPKKDEAIHHLNEDKTDNRVENLAIVPRSEHNRLHNENRVRDSNGRFVGKKAAGNLLDGKVWQQFPEVNS